MWLPCKLGCVDFREPVLSLHADAHSSVFGMAWAQAPKYASPAPMSPKSDKGKQCQANLQVVEERRHQLHTSSLGAFLFWGVLASSGLVLWALFVKTSAGELLLAPALALAAINVGEMTPSRGKAHELRIPRSKAPYLSKPRAQTETKAPGRFQLFSRALQEPLQRDGPSSARHAALMRCQQFQRRIYPEPPNSQRCGTY